MDDRAVSGVEMGISGVPKGEVGLTFRTGIVKHLRLALSSAGGIGIVLALFALLERQPGDGFKLLTQWGPWPIVILAALAIAGHFLSRLSDTLQTSLVSVVASVKQGAEAQQKIAEAQTRTADAMHLLGQQGGQHAEEIRRLAIYANREFPTIYERFDRQDAVLDRLTSAVARLGERDKT